MPIDFPAEIAFFRLAGGRNAECSRLCRNFSPARRLDGKTGSPLVRRLTNRTPRTRRGAGEDDRPFKPPPFSVQGHRYEDN